MNFWSLTSPDGIVEIEVSLSAAGRLSYRVRRDGREVVAASRLGIARTDQVFDASLSPVASVAGEEIVEVEDRYTMVHGKRRELCGRSRARTLTFANPAGSLLALDLRAYCDGVAFRYRFPSAERAEPSVGTVAGEDVVTGTGELTTVTPADEGRAWLQPTQAPFIHGPAYENLYADGVAIGTPSSGAAWDLPATFDSGGTWLLVTETDLDATCYGSRLGPSPEGRAYSFVPPQAGEGEGCGDVTATSTLPWTLPWRVIVIASSAGGLVESDLVSHLAEPSRIADPSWIRPGRVSWSWWADNDSPRDLARLRDYIDLAHEFGWEYSLVDANWTAHSDEEMRALVAYAAEREVRLFLWYNSGGPHNKVTEQPRDRMHERGIRRSELAKIAAWGIAGIKVDFFHSDKQDGIQRYVDILDDAADHRLMVNFHGCTIPRGWTRTWPHLMTMEAVRGAEQYVADPGFTTDAPRHNTILPFTRNAIGPMDYTPVTFSDNRHPHATTNVHELALSVVFESGLLHLADSPAAYRGVAPDIARVLGAVPVAWDETRCLAGEPGSHVVIARRRNGVWFVGGINGRSEPRTVELDLADLARNDSPWLVLTDGTHRDDTVSAAHHSAPGKPLRLVMASHGGFLATTHPAGR
jgi:alpha-glucosidase